jgi:hypothetical protein
MTALFLIFNHTFTRVQRDDAVASLGVGRIVDMPPDYQKIWSDIPPDLPSIEEYLEPVQVWLKANARENDFVLIQGDFGACHIMMNYSFRIGLPKQLPMIIIELFWSLCPLLLL